MTKVSIVFPHQLFEASPLLQFKQDLYLVEEELFFHQFAFHKQKLAFHRASMKAYADYLESKNATIHYVESAENHSSVSGFIHFLSNSGVEEIDYINPVDDWLERRLKRAANDNGIQLNCHVSPMFLNSDEELKEFFKPAKKKFYQTKFYIQERNKRKVLLDEKGEAEGGKWSFDAENRKKYPVKKQAPAVDFPNTGKYWNEAVEYVQSHFYTNPGELSEKQYYPIDFTESKQWLSNFLVERFKEFGDYEDAIVKNEQILNHSLLSPLMNAGLLTPKYVLSEALACGEEQEIPINSQEGFARQIMGWREFIRGVYVVKGREERTTNYWGFHRKIPPSFYDGTTGIVPLDDSIKKVLKNGYCHHIERLMVIGNFMLLCEIDPDEVYKWFMELFIDAYDWVMVPNVYGMSQFADGGLMSTKPYISGSNYIKKMSDYGKGDWQNTWDALFWRFMYVHRDFFLSNPRLGMLVKSFDKMPAEKQQKLLDDAEHYLNSLDHQNE